MERTREARSEKTTVRERSRKTWPAMPSTKTMGRKTATVVRVDARARPALVLFSLGAALVGLRLLGKQPIVGALVLAGAGLWLVLRLRRPKAPAMPLDEARALLDLPPDADPDMVHEAHRRLIARVHPDAGGSEELARRVNAARDALLDEMNRGPPRAS